MALIRFAPLFLVTHSKNFYLNLPRFLVTGSYFSTTSFPDGILTFQFPSFEFKDLADETINHVPVSFTFHHNTYKMSNVDALP